MSKEKAEYLAPEWSYLIDEDEVTEEPKIYSIEAPDGSLSALAQRYNVVSVDSIKADLEAVRESAGAVVHIMGRFEAKVTQECVVSGELVKNTHEEDFEAWFSDPEAVVSLTKARRQKEIERGGVEAPILEESEDPEPIVEGEIDLGEVVAQFLSLVIDPYPHAEGVQYELGDEDEEVKRPKAENPFAKLKDWKLRQSGSPTEE